MLAEVRHQRRHAATKEPVEQAGALGAQPGLALQERAVAVAAPIRLGGNGTFLQQAVRLLGLHTGGHNHLGPFDDFVVEELGRLLGAVAGAFDAQALEAGFQLR